jgi:hypothetical protein
MISESKQVRDWPDPAEIVGENFVDFDLTYSGRLSGSSNSKPQNKFKNELRNHFHQQLCALSGRPGMYENICWMTEARVKGNVLVEIPSAQKRRRYSYMEGHHYVTFHGSRYVPLITRSRGLVCHLAITLHRREKPGGIILGADIDNRLKTIFDALRIPHSADEAGSDTNRPDPFFCVLEDDSLITNLSVNTRELLRPATEHENADYAELTIHVAVKIAN